MSNPRKTGTIFFSSITQAALFEHELKGQLSDGMWENAAPHDHWKFWCALDVAIAPAGREPGVVTPNRWAIKKSGYNFAALYEVIGDRMLAIGRMARALLAAGLELGTFEHGSLRGAAEHMPPTLEEWRRCKESGKWQHDFVDPYMEPVTDELAQKFYAIEYDMRDLRKDISAIKSAMKSVTER